VGDGTVAAADVETGAVVLTHKVPQGFAAAAFNPDGSRYASFDGSGRVAIWDLASGEQVQSFRVAETRPESLAFSPDGRRVVVHVANSLRVWEVAPPREVCIVPQVVEGRGRPAFSPDGRFLALGTTRGLVRIWEVASGQMIQGLSGHTGGVLAVAFSPD